jgi:hypothetical protein
MHKDQTHIKRNCFSIGIISSKLQSGCYSEEHHLSLSIVAGKVMVLFFPDTWGLSGRAERKPTSVWFTGTHTLSLRL